MSNCPGGRVRERHLCGVQWRILFKTRCIRLQVWVLDRGMCSGGRKTRTCSSPRLSNSFHNRQMFLLSRKDGRGKGCLGWKVGPSRSPEVSLSENPWECCRPSRVARCNCPDTLAIVGIKATEEGGCYYNQRDFLSRFFLSNVRIMGDPGAKTVLMKREVFINFSAFLFFCLKFAFLTSVECWESGRELFWWGCQPLRCTFRHIHLYLQPHILGHLPAADRFSLRLGFQQASPLWRTFHSARTTSFMKRLACISANWTTW